MLRSMSHATRVRLVLFLVLAVLVALPALASEVSAAPRQPSIAQKGDNHKAECNDLGGSFESGTYTDADTGAVTNYSVCFVGESMVICEWTATTDFCLGAFPGAIHHGDSRIPPIDERAPLAPETPVPTQPAHAKD